VHVFSTPAPEIGRHLSLHDRHAIATVLFA
jgi:hypothetical protein